MGEGGATESLLLVGKLESLVGGFLLLFCSGTRSRKDKLNFFSGISKWGSALEVFFLFRPGLVCLGGGIIYCWPSTVNDALPDTPSSPLSLGWRRGSGGSRGCTKYSPRRDLGSLRGHAA